MKELKGKITASLKTGSTKNWVLIILIGIGLCALTVFYALTKNGLLDWITLGLVWTLWVLYYSVPGIRKN